ncbi:DUF4136 domain-containing protein [Novosphingobium sp. Gsoil 351]|uniref:DUF4136 domain-containing protein n=1 Tax=Novosphingobium sp. Gsoil 351 TaxID=2675225 RepID=UPI0018A87FA4|nr:DUF4136 domain-containing protein [Novosphingobium sp. Gsoil 351]
MSIYLRSAVFALAAMATVAGFQATTADAKTLTMQVGAPLLPAGSSFAWAPTSSALVDPANSAVANQITARRLQTAIETNLAAHGFRKAASPAISDLAVSFHVVLKQQQGARLTDTAATFCGWRGCVRRWGAAPVVTTYDYTHGTLVIDLVDRQTGDLVWRAASEDRVTQSDLSQSHLNSMVAKMMKSLPPS